MERGNIAGSGGSLEPVPEMGAVQHVLHQQDAADHDACSQDSGTEQAAEKEDAGHPCVGLQDQAQQLLPVAVESSIPDIQGRKQELKQEKSVDGETDFFFSVCRIDDFGQLSVKIQAIDEDAPQDAQGRQIVLGGLKKFVFGGFQAAVGFVPFQQIHLIGYQYRIKKQHGKDQKYPHFFHLKDKQPPFPFHGLITPFPRFSSVILH